MNRLPDPTTLTRCAVCDALFHCGARNATPCWCAALPALPADQLAPGSCLCPACLRQRLAEAA
jgi:hypothetical protein